MLQAFDRYVQSPFRESFSERDSKLEFPTTSTPPKLEGKPSRFAEECLSNTDVREAYEDAKTHVEWGRGLTLDEMIVIGHRAGKPEALVREDYKEAERERDATKLHSEWCDRDENQFSINIW